MQETICLFDYCINTSPLNSSQPRLFGFPEFLSGLALIVIAWTTADIRYKFRVRVAPIPLQTTTFYMVAVVGILTLLTDLWRGQAWHAPEFHYIPHQVWQAIVAAAFLMTFLLWAWYAFIKPPRYGQDNAKKFAKALYDIVLKGDPSELKLIIDEINPSLRNIVFYAPESEHRFKDDAPINVSQVEGYANDLLLLFGDKRFCKVVAATSPATAMILFKEMRDRRKLRLPVQTFARNFLDESVANKESFMYHEAEGYDSGLLGYHKPITHSVWSSYEMVETVNTLLDPNLLSRKQWDYEQWEAFCRVTLITLKDYAACKYHGHSYSLYRALSSMKNSLADLYKLNETPIDYHTDSNRRLQIIVEFINNAIKILEESSSYKPKKTKSSDDRLRNFEDTLAEMIAEIISHASSVQRPWWTTWTIQHNNIWGDIHGSGSSDGPVAKSVRFKLRRLLYNEIVDMEASPNFKGAKILGFCLNVMGPGVFKGDYGREYRGFHKAVLQWTKRNYAALNNYNPQIAAACLVESYSYDTDRNALVRTREPNAFRRDPELKYIDLDPAAFELPKRRKPKDRGAM